MFGAFGVLSVTVNTLIIQTNSRILALSLPVNSAVLWSPWSSAVTRLRGNLALIREQESRNPQQIHQ